MTMLNVDLSQTPDTLPQPTAGIYKWKIEEVPVVKPGKEDPSKNTLHAQLKLQNEGEFMGVPMMMYIGLDSKMGQVTLKRLILSMGGDPEKRPIDVSTWLGKEGYCTIVRKVDTSTGRAVERANIGDILIPGDQGHPMPKAA